jgi:hypothetical protein
MDAAPTWAGDLVPAVLLLLGAAVRTVTAGAEAGTALGDDDGDDEAGILGMFVRSCRPKAFRVAHLALSAMFTHPYDVDNEPTFAGVKRTKTKDLTNNGTINLRYSICWVGQVYEHYLLVNHVLKSEMERGGACQGERSQYVLQCNLARRSKI